MSIRPSGGFPHIFTLDSGRHGTYSGLALALAVGSVDGSIPRRPTKRLGVTVRVTRLLAVVRPCVLQGNLLATQSTLGGVSRLSVVRR